MARHSMRRHGVWFAALLGCSTPVSTATSGFSLPDTQIHLGDVAPATGVDVAKADGAPSVDVVPADAAPDVVDDVPAPAIRCFVADDAATDKAAAQSIPGLAGTDKANQDTTLAAQGVEPSYAALWLPGQDMDAGCHIARWSAKPRD